MKSKLRVIMVALCISVLGFSFAFAEGDGTQQAETTAPNLTTNFHSDYHTDTVISNDEFNPAIFTFETTLNVVDWLGLSGKSGKVTLRTGASKVKISEKLPNLINFAVAETTSRAAMTGQTFTCRSTPAIEWNGETGEWRTIINTPTERIRYALDTLKDGYIQITDPGLRGSTQPQSFPPFFDNMIQIKAGTTIQYGKTVLTFTKDCEIDELYDEKCQKDYFESTFAENIYRIKTSTTSESLSEIPADGAVKLTLARGSFLQFCESRFTAKKDIEIHIDNAEVSESDPLSAVIAAIATAKNTEKPYADSRGRYTVDHESQTARDNNDIHPYKAYKIHTCDVDAVFDSGFALLNDIIGILSNSDAKIVIVSDEEDVSEERTINENAATVASFTISSKEPCRHTNTEVRDALKATVTTMGYTGDTYCLDCGELVSEGNGINKLPSSIKLNYTSIKLKTKQSTSAVKATFTKGDSIRSITSSNTSIVKGVKSGSNTIKLTAGTKTGTAKVTVKFASQNKVAIIVNVQAVACTGLKVTNGTTVKLKKGKTHKIKVTRSPVTCVQKITYKSSNKKVATVSSSGKVKAKKKGTAKIKIKCGKKTATVKIKVK